MTARRLQCGGLIDRNAPIDFYWDATKLPGFSGDSLASALLANNVDIVGRSFKYHRPRGIMSAGVEESGAIVTVGEGPRTDPNIRATTQELYQGLRARGQNAWPSVRFDVGAINNVFGRFFAAGFYYKTFMGIPPMEWGKGTAIWMQYEKLIRRAAGMGTASREPDPDNYEHAHAHCDLLVVGAGPAGIAAALEASRVGLDVWLVEQDSQIGGTYLSTSSDSMKQEFANARTVLETAGVTVMPRTTVFGLYDNSVAGLVERVTDHLATPSDFLPRQRFWTLRAQHTILAAGALERTLVFENNDKPGVMNAGSAQIYLNRYSVLAGQNIVLATNNDSVYPVAAELANAGASVRVIDARESLTYPSVSRAAEEAGAHIYFRTAPINTTGKRKIKRVTTAVKSGTSWRSQADLECDLLLVSGGWSPVVNLLSHRGIKPVWNQQVQAFLPPPNLASMPGGTAVTMAGASTGSWDHIGCVESGRRAARSAIEGLQPGFIAGCTEWQESTEPSAGQDDSSDPLNPIEPLFEVRSDKTQQKSFVDPQHDVTADDIRLAHREGFVSVEHLKRYTTLGMATDQGKVGNVMGIALMADALGLDMDKVGTTTFRPPYTPVSIGALRGRHVGAHFRPLRRTPMHRWNLDHECLMIDAGLWQRPWYFPQPNEALTSAYVREARTVRETVGICDVTSLGKIAVQGPDATEFLNRVYANAFAKLPVGKARYGIMLRDDGMVLDDGTTWRLDECEYFMTTTTAHAGKVMVWLEELLQCRWPELHVHVTSVTDQWAGVALAGPLSRQVLSSIVEGTDVSNDALPFMGVVDARFRGGLNGRIARISFSGELAYELYVPADFGLTLMDLLWQPVQALEGCLYGLEALGTLRIEKGHVTGAELDGNVTIDDAGLGRMASTSKAYIGSALRQRPELLREDRPQLVGLYPINRDQTFNAGSLLFSPGNETGHGEGWITGVTYSPELGHWIGLGFINGGVRQWEGKELVTADPVRDGRVPVEVVSPHMVDPKGEKLHG